MRVFQAAIHSLLNQRNKVPVFYLTLPMIHYPYEEKNQRQRQEEVQEFT